MPSWSPSLDLDHNHGGLVPTEGPVGLGTSVGMVYALAESRVMVIGHLRIATRATAGSGQQRSAQRAARAMMVSAGLAEPWVGNTLPSTR